MPLPPTDTTIPVVVLVLRPSAVRHRALPIARSVGRLGVPVHLVQAGPPEAEAQSRFVTRVVEMPRTDTIQGYVDAVMRVGRELGRAVLVPTDDAGTVLVDDHADLLAEHFLMPRDRGGAGRVLASKRQLHLLCERLGLPSPLSAFPATVDDAVGEAQRVGYPVVVKRIDGWRAPADPRAPSVAVAEDRAALIRAWAAMQSLEGSNVMLQELLPGNARSGWMYNGYFDERSRALVEFTGRKVRQHPPGSGVTSLGEAVANEAVAAPVRTLLEAVGYRGMVDADVYLDERDAVYKILDVNPRIGATFRLFVDEDGIDVLRAAYRHLTGQPVLAARQRLGRKWIAEPLDIDSAVRQRLSRELTLREWARSLRRVEEGAWFALDDPLPALAVALPISSAVRRRLARARRDRGRRR